MHLKCMKKIDLVYVKILLNDDIAISFQVLEIRRPVKIAVGTKKTFLCQWKGPLTWPVQFGECRGHQAL